ncbi:MAG: hypothetical protein OXF50_05555 [Caldilineaceae bacterium]|nr:hypothetical protein [Caldilineaceae bacterium]
MDALHAPENEDVSEQKNHFTPHTTNAQKAKKPGQHYPGLLTTISRALASAKAHHDHPQAHLAAQGRASASRQKEAFDTALFK